MTVGLMFGKFPFLFYEDVSRAQDKENLSNSTTFIVLRRRYLFLVNQKKQKQKI